MSSPLFYCKITSSPNVHKWRDLRAVGGEYKVIAGEASETVGAASRLIQSKALNRKFDTIIRTRKSRQVIQRVFQQQNNFALQKYFFLANAR